MSISENERARRYALSSRGDFVQATARVFRLCEGEGCEVWQWRGKRWVPRVAYDIVQATIPPNPLQSDYEGPREDVRRLAPWRVRQRCLADALADPVLSQCGTIAANAFVETVAAAEGWYLATGSAFPDGYDSRWEKPKNEQQRLQRLRRSVVVAWRDIGKPLDH